jgi:hypothetical protein
MDTCTGCQRYLPVRFRAILVEHGVLAPRDERLIGLERVINRRIARVEDPAERRILRSYATWRHLRRLRTVADRQTITADQVAYACKALTAAAGLLNWLHGRSQSLATSTQDHIDHWLVIDAFSRSRGFVTWAVGCGHAHNIEVPPFNNEPVREVFTDHDQRWSLARQALVNDRRAAGTGSQDEVWLYPAARLGKPLAPRILLQRLRAIGVQVTIGRNMALMDMASEMPATLITSVRYCTIARLWPSANP